MLNSRAEGFVPPDADVHLFERFKEEHVEREAGDVLGAGKDGGDEGQEASDLKRGESDVAELGDAGGEGLVHFDVEDPNGLGNDGGDIGFEIWINRGWRRGRRGHSGRPHSIQGHSTECPKF
jgi:hypothetical protein